METAKLQALLNLLDDPDQSVYEMVEQALIKDDSLQIEQLERLWETSLDELLQQRIEDLLCQIQFRKASEKIQCWSSQEEVDLFEGFFLISQYQYPELKEKPIENQIRKISNDVSLELNNRLTSLEKITVLNHVLYDVNKFGVNFKNMMLPSNCYINQLLETKKGSPISIVILYAIIARQLGFPIEVYNFPSFPLVAYIDPDATTQAGDSDVSGNVLFFINPSNKGAIIGRKEIEHFVSKHKKDNKTLLKKPATDKELVKMLIDYLIDSYKSVGLESKVNDLYAISVLL